LRESGTDILWVARLVPSAAAKIYLSRESLPNTFFIQRAPELLS
jgi:hypothetical protein